MKVVVAVLSVLLLLYVIQGSRHPANPPGILVPREPDQSPTVERTWRKNGYTITALARYRIQALVISTERYWLDGGADLSPVDFAVGWGPLSDVAIVDKLSIHQGQRWFRYNTYGRSLPSEDVIISHAANMHMIPADERIEKQLKSVAPRDIVDMRGYLVEAHGANGFKWRSSLTRTDNRQRSVRADVGGGDLEATMRLFLWWTVTAASLTAATQMDIFRAGDEGYHTYRIPALVATKRGTLLAFCEGRHASGGDSGDIDLLLKRSFDNGKTWTKAQVVADFGGDTIGNPAPVVEQKTGAIMLLLTRNPGDITEKQIVESSISGTRTVWIARSFDDGASWTAPAEITRSVKKPDWTWYATGPGAGIQLRTGRLVIPCDHIERGTKARRSHVIYSDDRGKTWSIGGIADENTNESTVAELRDGSLLLNMRSYHGQNRRAIAYSSDGGLTWSKTALDAALVEPVCQASLIRAGRKSDGRLLFSNPADMRRDRLTVRLSRDDGKTWAVSKVVHAGPAAYSSLAVLRDSTVGLLYERGDTSAYERISFVRFTLEWLTSGD